MRARLSAFRAAFSYRRAPRLAACAALLLSTPAAAGPGARARLRYQRLAGAESCPSQTAFQAEIAAWLGYDPFADSSPRSVVIDLSGSASGLGAHLQLEDVGGKILGERQIVTASSDCRDLTQALVLAVALAVDPLPITRDVIIPGEAALSPAVQAPAPTPASPAHLAGPNAELSFSVGSLWVVGGPRVSPGLMAGLEARWDHFSIGIEGEGDAFTGEPFQSGSVQVSLVSAELVPCYRMGVFGFCGPVVAAGAELGHGEGIHDASSQPLPYVGVGARVLADLPIAGPVSLRLQIDALGTLVGATFDVVGSPQPADVWDTPALTFQAAAALVLHL